METLKIFYMENRIYALKVNVNLSVVIETFYSTYYREILIETIWH